MSDSAGWTRIDELSAEVRRLRVEVTDLRQQLAAEIVKLAPYNCELLPDGREDPRTAAWVEGIKDAADLVRGAAEQTEPQPAAVKCKNPRYHSSHRWPSTLEPGTSYDCSGRVAGSVGQEGQQ